MAAVATTTATILRGAMLRAGYEIVSQNKVGIALMWPGEEHPVVMPPGNEVITLEVMQAIFASLNVTAKNAVLVGIVSQDLT